MKISSLNTRLEPLETFSALSGLPAVGFLQAENLYIAVYRNIIMSYEDMALIFAQRVLNVFPTPMMKQHAYVEFKKALTLGVINKPDWIYETDSLSRITSRYSLLSKRVPIQIEMTEQQLVSTLDKRNAMVV